MACCHRAVGLALSSLVLLCGCRAAQPISAESSKPAEDDCRLLAAWLCGSFSSAAQHQADPENFFDIRLHMMPIWPARTDGPWIYVEQAAAEKLDQPYRQRVYRLAPRSDGAIESVVHELPGDALRFAGAWRDPSLLDQLTPEQLIPREGCSLILRRTAAECFTGSTVGRTCISTLRGAAYATSEATVTPFELITWDRGYDAEGRQVWGATKGGYVFRRQ